MTTTHQITLNHQFNSIKKGLVWLLITFGVFVLSYFAETIAWMDISGMIIFFLLFNLAFFLPAFYLHFTYYFENRNTLLVVDSDSKQISITVKNRKQEFSFDDILLAEQHPGIYYKNNIDNRNRRVAPWSGYGYLKLKLKNGQIYYFTSLMMDIHNPPFPFSKTKFRFLPFINRQEPSYADTRKWMKKEKQIKYEEYLEKFAGLPKAVLQEKIDKAKLYEPEAVAAAKKILEKTELNPE